MAAVNFRVENQKALRLAECSAVPPLMIICGANGTGKSTLLWALKQRIGLGLEPVNTQVLYQGPHRAIRRQAVQRRWLGGAPLAYSDLLAQDSVNSLEGLQIPYPSRSPDNIDESGSAIKHTLARLENRRQSYVTAIYDEAVKSGAKQLDIASVKNIFAPLADIIARLLPHLRFTGIDFAQEDNVRIAFERLADLQDPVNLDLDDLSSGEKAVILLFLPLVEAEIRSNLDTFATADAPPEAAAPDRLFLLDEPELHLHPDLQRRMLAYMRERSSRHNIQFIVITHSPTILDEASDEELYVLTLPTGQENQLRRAASPAERLEALRELTGESYFLSTGRNIICCEGEPSSVKGKASDRSLIELFSTKSSRYTFIPMGGKSQVVAAVARLRKSLPVAEYGMVVVGLVDEDQAGKPPAGCTSWPFCEIENALLQPAVIATVVNQLDPERTLAASDVTKLLKEAATELRDDEIRLRIAQRAWCEDLPSKRHRCRQRSRLIRGVHQGPTSRLCGSPHRRRSRHRGDIG